GKAPEPDDECAGSRLAGTCGRGASSCLQAVVVVQFAWSWCCSLEPHYDDPAEQAATLVTPEYGVAASAERQQGRSRHSLCRQPFAERLWRGGAPLRANL